MASERIQRKSNLVGGNMPDVIRYNKVIELLEQGETVFASGLVWLRAT